MVGVRYDKEINRIPEVALHIAEPEEAQRGLFSNRAVQKDTGPIPLRGCVQGFGRLNVTDFIEEFLILGSKLLRPGAEKDRSTRRDQRDKHQDRWQNPLIWQTDTHKQVFINQKEPDHCIRVEWLPMGKFRLGLARAFAAKSVLICANDLGLLDMFYI